MNKIRVVTWNAEGMFVAGTRTRRATPHDALMTLEKLDADVVVVPEFGLLADLKNETLLSIEAFGYEVTLLPYDEPRAPGVGFAIFSRLKVSSSRVHELNKSRRQLLEVRCVDESGLHIRVLGVHLDDRSEEGRLNEVASVVDIVNQQLEVPTLLMGDFNAMHGDSLFAKGVRSLPARHATKLVTHELIRSMAERVIEMASGTTIAYLTSHTKLHDADPGRKRTISGKQEGLEWMPSWRLAKIDWIFTSHHFSTLRYRVMRDAGSDHRPVVADLELRT